ncbi:MAG: hypothetical protein WBD53_18500, partial [Xanthobacteraceae bacterium]
GGAGSGGAGSSGSGSSSNSGASSSSSSGGGGGGGSVAIGGFSGGYSAAAGGVADAIGPRCVAVLKDPRRYEHRYRRLWEHCRFLAERYARRHQASR